MKKTMMVVLGLAASVVAFAGNTFRTAPTAFRPVRFVAYADSETQTAPKTGTWEDWRVDRDDGTKTGSRKYYVSKEVGFAPNVCAMTALKPDFVAETEEPEPPVAPTYDYYVSVDGNDDTNDGRTPKTAFRTVQKALDEASSEEVTTVLVGPGTYISTVPLTDAEKNSNGKQDKSVMAFTFDKPVHLIAADGPAVTFLDAGTDISRAFGTMTHADALIAGFTFKNGKNYEKAKQSGLTASNGVVSNCVFSVRSNWANNGWLLSASGTFKGYDLVIKPFTQDAAESNMPFLFDGDSTVDGVVATNCVWTGTPKPILQLNGNAKARNVLVADCTFGNKPVSSLNSLVLLNGTGVVLADSTIAHNTLTAPNGALNIGNTKATVTNCIIAVNSCTGTHPDINNASNLGRCFQSCASDFAADNANGNINVNPLFVDVEHADYHLKPLSQAREMGIVEFRPSGASDELDCAADADVYTSEAGESLTAHFSGYCGGAQGDVTAVWDFGDGETSDEWPKVEHTFKQAGRFTVTLTVSDGKSTVTYTIPKSFLAKPAVCYVKEGNAGVFPYDTWEKATPNLKDAYETGALVIHVTNGTYEIAAPYIDINRKLTLTSVEGPEKTILKSVGSGDHRHFTVSGSDDIFIAGFAFEGGYANNYGWTATISMSKGVLSNCVVRKTSRVSRSSALSFSGTAKVYDCIFDGTGLAYNNQGTGTGGILLADSALLDRCVIQNYKVTSYNTDGLRGPLMMNASDVVVRNSLVTGCGFGSGRVEKDSGGGVVLVAGTLENCTIVGNSCGGYGGGIYVRGASATIRNCIVWGNTAAAEKGADIYSSYDAVVPTCTCASSFDDVKGGAGEGCTTKDPNFDAEKPYHLTPRSAACIDKAAAQDWMADASDLDRLPRIKHDGPDLGCYEFQDSLVVPLDGSIDVTSAASGRLPLATSFEASIVGDETGLEIVWNFGDGTVVAGGKLVSHTYTASGSYPVTAHVTNAKGEEKDLATKSPVIVVPMTCYVSTTGRNVSPYATWEDAANRIEDAVALNPKTVVVSNGTYKTSGDGIVLSSDIELKSLNGPAVTKINAQGVCRNVWLTDEQAVCSGFSLANGYGDWYNSDIAATVTKGTLTNCVVPSISVYQYRAPVIRVGEKGKVTGCVIDMTGMDGNDNGENYFCSVLVSGGSIENCEIRNYKSTARASMSTPRAALTLTGAATARNILVHDCTSTPSVPNGQQAAAVVLTGSGTLENCTIVDSTGRTSGAGLTIASPLTSEPIVRNCIITSCTAKDGAAHPDVRDVNSATAPRVTYSCSADLTAREGNVANVSGLFTTRTSRPKYSLSPSSPAKNAGVKLGWMEGAVDLVGNPRVYGGKPDMGCYESLSGGLMMIVR